MLQRVGQGEYIVTGRSKSKRLCPHCHKNFVLWAWPGGFMACYLKACKSAAIDEALDEEERTRERKQRQTEQTPSKNVRYH